MVIRARALSSVLLAAAISAWAAAAGAHALLVSAIPEPDGTVAKAPAEVTVTLSEAVEPAFVALTVTDASGTPVQVGEPRVEAGKTLAVGLGELAPGTYTVAWKVTSVDTHSSESSYTFTVAP